MSTTATTLASLAKAREEAKQRVATALPDDQSKTKAADDLVNKLNSPEVKKQAYESVKSLSQAILNIRTGFLDVAGTLVKFDSKNFKDQDGNVLSFGKEWNPFIREFDEILYFNLEQATDARTLMRSVTAVLGDVTGADGKDLAMELAEFMKPLGPKEAGALEMKTRFQKLADDVILFSAKIDVALAKADANIKADLENARTRLASLTQELEAWNQQINVSAGEIIGAIAVGASQTVTALLALDFSGMMTTVNSIVNSITHEAEMKKAECEQSINLVNQEISGLLARDKDFATLRTGLEESKKAVASSQILIIMDVWKTINLDLRSLEQALSSQLKDDPVITKFFLKKLGVAKEIYQRLALLLEIYVEKIRTN
ncbi:hypothetical protein K438DRAFT_1856419 [Mycena galopus ATCC 62051]|nr:hypothetical protein K438DRAFT_1856419 [Mycena galopus ATCC 62051]